MCDQQYKFLCKIKTTIPMYKQNILERTGSHIIIIIASDNIWYWLKPIACIFKIYLLLFWAFYCIILIWLCRNGSNKLGFIFTWENEVYSMFCVDLHFYWFNIICIHNHKDKVGEWYCFYILPYPKIFIITLG